MDKIWLFSYGTLSHPEYIQLLLKRLPKFEDGILWGFDLFIHPENKYLFIKPVKEKFVTGKLFEVTQKELKIIDLWEDVPLYSRELLAIKTQNSTIKAFVYTQNETDGLSFQPHHQKKHAEILKDIIEFRAWIEKNNSF